MFHRVQATIDRKALAHNLTVAKRHAGNSRIVAMVKANAYGHGLLPTAEALNAADIFGVTDIDEAERLHAGGTEKDILILQGIIERADIARVARYGFQLVVHRLEDLTLLEQELTSLTLRHPLTLWLKLDSGMGRLGVMPKDFVEAWRLLHTKPWVKEVVLMTHLANASIPDSPLNARQIACFQATGAQLEPAPKHRSIAASSALLALDTEANWARPGIMLYGSSPFAWSDLERRREAFDLKPVMTLEGRLIRIAEHQAGDNIGYNSQFVCPRPMRIGTVACGYADGYPSNTPNGAPVAIRGKRSVTTGRVSMDMLAIDLTDIPEAKLGDAVELWGSNVSIDEVAAHMRTISYNLTCNVSARVPLVYR